jgi:hypothetical protein
MLIRLPRGLRCNLAVVQLLNGAVDDAERLLLPILLIESLAYSSRRSTR